MRYNALKHRVCYPPPKSPSCEGDLRVGSNSVIARGVTYHLNPLDFVFLLATRHSAQAHSALAPQRRSL